tara:strand:+ start:569 stop:781 length:213 start_codon:yes stop_codon:yes gene_type:complete
VITSWTAIILLTNTTFNLEINELISKMYINQKSFIYNVKDLSILLVKDAKERFIENDKRTINVNNINKID